MNCLTIPINNKKVLLTITTLQEAFSAIIPFFLLNSMIMLFYFLLRYLNTSVLGIDAKSLGMLVQTLNTFSSLVASIAIAYFFAIRFKVSEIIAVTLSVATFTTILLIESSTIPVELPYGFTPASLFNPIVSTWFLAYFFPKLSLNIPLQDENRHIYKLFNYLFVFAAAYIATVGLYFIIDSIMDSLIDQFNQIHLNLPPVITLALRDLTIQLFWFFGIHGEHTVNALFGKTILDVMMLPNLTYGEFNRLFVVIGGAGIGLGLWIALYLYAKEGMIRVITKISLPFVLFNINTLLTYAVVVLNRFFLIPFLILPIFNLFIAYLLLQWIPCHFTSYYITWITPVFFDSYLKTDGNMAVLLLQAILLLLDTLIYIYFTKRFIQSQSHLSHKETLEDNLDIPNELRSKEHVHAFHAHKKIIEANVKVAEIIQLLTHHKLHVYYQPKIDIAQQECRDFEALLRLEQEGEMKGPHFLPTLETAGLAPVIDIWVCRQVKEHLSRWHDDRFYPHISINLHPDTIKSKDAISKIIHILKGYDISFEIIERTFLFGEKAEKNIKALQKQGFALVIDDFGAGYSSLETITKHTIKELKLDKSLIDIIEDRKGFLVCKHTINLCHEMGCSIVAEGVETRTQLDILKRINVDFVQGYYFSKAIAFDKIKSFYESFGEHRDTN